MLDPTRPLLSPQDLADHLSLPLKTIYAMNSRGTGPRFIRIGRHIRYYPEDVIHWVTTRSAAVSE